MKLSRFKTFTTSYYFPINLTKDLHYMYGLYSAYGGRLSKIYWALYKKYKLVRWLTSVDEKELDFPYTLIKNLAGDDSILSFNMGSPGIEQKISILGYDPNKQQPFFAKFAQKEDAKVLSRNEIHILQKLADTRLAPALMDHRITDDYVFLKTECVKGKRPASMLLTKEVTDICINLSKLHLTGQMTNEDGLQLSLSHGDFCPWNFLENDGKLRLIDWEMAKDRPLGYDLFTYIFQTAFLFTNKETIVLIEENKAFIRDYFHHLSIHDFNSYLKAFSKEKSLIENKKNNPKLSDKYQQMLAYLSN